MTSFYYIWVIKGKPKCRVKFPLKQIRNRIRSRLEPRNSTRSSSSKSKSSTQEKAVGKKLRLTELIVEASFMKKKRDAEYQAEALRMEEELTKEQEPRYMMTWKGLTLELARMQKYFCQRSLKIMKLPYQICQKEWHLRRPNQDNLGLGHYTLR